MAEPVKKVLIIAGDPSGEKHASHFISYVNKAMPGIEWRGVGGDNMAAEGVHLLFHVRQTAILGFAEVIKHLPFVLKMMKTCVNLVKSWQPSLVILVDYPGFNMRFAKKIHGLNVPVLYYISPQVWAWGKDRIQKIKAFITHMLVIFPFEHELYQNHGVPSTFVGHPLVESLKNIRQTVNSPVDVNRIKVGLLPGSRLQEVEALLPIMINAVLPLWEKGVLMARVAAVESVGKKIYESLTPENFEIKVNEVHEVIHWADIILVASGTATLETGMLGKPMVIIYKTNPVTYWIGKHILKLKMIGLVNIILKEKVMPECIQSDANPETVRQELTTILNNPDIYYSMVSKLDRIWSILGSKNASQSVGDRVIQTLKGESLS